MSLALGGCFSEPRILETEREIGDEDPSAPSDTMAPGASSGGETGEAESSSSGWGWGTAWTTSTSDGDDEHGTDGGSGGSSTDAPGVCGDGHVDSGEACDEPPQAVQGGCRPDCTVVEDREIRLSAVAVAGDFGGDPIAFADGQCPAGYKALFAFDDARQVKAPSGALDPIDWALQPYTAYVNRDGDLLGVTDDAPILGDLLAPVVEDAGGSGAATGLDASWMTLTTDNCDDWTRSIGGSKRAGVPYLTQPHGYLDNGGIGICENHDYFYCVEQ